MEDVKLINCNIGSSDIEVLLRGMDIKELRQKTDKELVELAASLREQLRSMGFDVAADALKDVREIRDAKKSLARILTIMTERAKNSGSATLTAK
jgi:ribosomal protein L29